MKLSTVKLDRQIKVGKEFSDEWDARNVSLEYDRASDMVRIGDQGDEVPRSAVVQWNRDRTAPETKQTCPVCERPFNNAQALGSHRAHSAMCKRETT